MSMPIAFHAVVERERARLLGAVDRVGDLAEPHELPVPLGDDEIHELLRPFEAALQTDGALVEVAVHAADRRREVLRLQRLHDLRRR